MNPAGWIKLHRKMIDWEWYQDIPVKTLFIHLLLTVNREEKHWRGQSIPRGSRMYGLHQIALETGLTLQQTRTAIKKLEATNEITNKTTNKGSVISIKNFDIYQEGESNQQAINKQSTNNPTNHQQPYKKERSKKEEYINPLTPLPENWDLFLKFRKEIRKPVTESQKPALLKKAYRLASESRCMPDEILQQSIENGWQGIFALRKESENDKRSTTRKYSSGDAISEIFAELREGR